MKKATAVFSIFLMFFTACGGGNNGSDAQQPQSQLVFNDSASYDIPASTVGTAITPINVSGGASGGTPPYAFSAAGLPLGITISTAGVISGTPTFEMAAGTATVTVTDNTRATRSITINYGAVTAAIPAFAYDIDSDGDGLSDWEEINIYGTDPYLADTDGDGVSDFLEILYGTDPLVPNINFPQTRTIGEPDKVNTVTASVSMTLRADQVGTLEITPVTVADDRMLSPAIPGYLGVAYNFAVSGAFNSANISFHYDKSLGTIGQDFQPRIYYYDETSGLLSELSNGEVLVSELSDPAVSYGTVTAEVSHFSKYILLNSVEFNAVWHYDIRKPSAGGGTGIYQDIDVVFVMDESNSMENMKSGENNDPNRLRVAAAKRFVDALEANDRAGIIGFSDDARTILSLTYDNYTAKTYLDMVAGNRGGTQIFNGIEAGIEELRINGRSDADKLIIVMTDGTDDPDAPPGAYNRVVANAQAHDITIYTVGLGWDVNAILLTYIAESTGGKYFYAETADDLFDGYDLIRDEAIDYRTDSNGDGISDYYAKLIFEGKLRLQNGSMEMFMVGADIHCNADLDGDGLLNGEELVIIEVGDKVMIRMVSDPFLKDSDFDGYPDNVDKHPLQRDYLSDDVSDFMALIENGRYQYSTEAANYSNDYWQRLFDTVVAAISFTDVQQEYTMQMVNFIIENASDYHIEKAAMAELERAIRNATYEVIGEILSFIDIVDSDALSALELSTRIYAGEQIKAQKEKMTKAINEGRKADSMDGYLNWFDTYAKEYLDGITLPNGQKINLPPFSMEKKGIPDNLIQGVKMLGALADGYELASYFAPGDPSSLPGFGSAKIAFDLVEMGSDIKLMWDAAKYIALDNANEGVFFQNYDLFCELRDNGKHKFTKSAAKFVVDSMTMSYLDASNGQNLRHVLIKGAGIYVSVVMTFIKVAHPVGWCIIAAKTVFDLCDVIFGWSDRAVGRGGIICLHDMTGATIKFVNSYYLTDRWEDFGRHLENLANLRIAGETKFRDVYAANVGDMLLDSYYSWWPWKSDVDREAQRANARENIMEVKQIANKLGLVTQ